MPCSIHEPSAEPRESPHPAWFHVWPMVIMRITVSSACTHGTTVYSENMSQIATEWPRRHRLTVDDYYRMGEAGILRPGERVELIEGEILDMAPIGTRHSAAVDQLAELLRLAAGDHAIVRTQNPVLLDNQSEPEPDLALLRRRADYYRSAHPRPTDVFLIVEVADSSLGYDRDIKVPLYARHGVPEVWLIDIESRALARYREPAQGSFRRLDQPDLGTPIELHALPDVRIDLGALFGD
jgi:Uma2 family endonuclease